MKIKMLLVLVFWGCFTIVTNGQANSYFENNPVWIAGYGSSAATSCVKLDTYNYSIQGDTLIDMLVYKKIFRKGRVSFLYPGCTPYQYANLEPSFFLRSESRKMFIILRGATTEYLLYDFNVGVGDTLHYSAFAPDYIGDNTLDYGLFFQGYEIIQDIDSLRTPNGYLRIFYYDTLVSASNLFIEGIGSSAGLVEPIPHPIEVGWNLSCYSIGDSLYYPVSSPQFGNCDMDISLAGVEHENSTLDAGAIFPNPTQGYLQLNVSEEYIGYEFSISDLEGRIRQKGTFVSPTTVVDVQSFSPGVYIIRWEKQGVAVFRKFVKVLG